MSICFLIQYGCDFFWKTEWYNRFPCFCIPLYIDEIPHHFEDAGRCLKDFGQTPHTKNFCYYIFMFYIWTADE